MVYTSGVHLPGISRKSSVTHFCLTITLYILCICIDLYEKNINSSEQKKTRFYLVTFSSACPISVSGNFKIPRTN